MIEIKNVEKNSRKQELEEMQAEIQVELEKIRSIQKSLLKLTKQTKLDKKIAKRTKTSKTETLPNGHSSDKSAKYKTAFTLPKSLNLASYSKRNTVDGTSVSLFNKNIISELSLNKKSNFDDLINGMNRIINDNQIVPNYVYKKLSKNTLIEYISKLSEPIGLSSTYKEKLSEMFLLYSAMFHKKPVVHPSLKKVFDYLSEDNLVCGINFAKGVQGFDQMIIKVEDGNGFRRLKFLNLIELKYRYKNNLSWQVPSQTYNPKIFELSLKNILNNNMEIGAYVRDKSGKITLNMKSSFGRFLSETRGNGAIIKMDQWSDQIAEIAKIWKKSSHNRGKTFPLDEIVPNSKGKTLQNCLEEVMLEQFRLEALAESEFVINYTGSLLGNYSVLPLQDWKFRFITDDKSLEQVIRGKDFRVFNETKSIKKFEISHPSFTEKLDVKKYFTFPLVENKKLIDFLHFNPQKYRIFISEDVNEIITCDNGFIICSLDYFNTFKQYLCGEIKTRFVNDIRDCLKLSGWNEIVSEDFRFEHDLLFSTSNPIPKDYFNKYSGEYRFHDNLHKLKADHHILGIDNVNCYALRPDKDTRDNIKSEWYRSLDNRFHRGTTTFIPLEVNEKLKDPFLDLSKTYGHNIPNPEWIGYGMLSVNTFVSSGKYGIKQEYLTALEADSKDLLKNLPKEHSHDFILQNYDIYSESKNLFSRDSIYTIEDITKSFSNQSEREIRNEIRAEHLTRQSFDSVTDESELLVTLIQKNDTTKKLIREGDDILILDYTFTVHRDQVNYFPIVRKYKNKSTGSRRYRFEIHSASPYVLQSVRNNLLECPWLSAEGQLDIENRYEDWMERLTKANSVSLNNKKPIQVSLNAFEAIWLLIFTLKSMSEIESELFSEFLTNYNYLIATNSHNETLELWPIKYGELKLENFRKFYSFGLMGASMRRYNHRNIYEIMSNEFRQFADMIYNKCMQLLMYSSKKPYLKWVRNFMDELGEILYLK